MNEAAPTFGHPGSYTITSLDENTAIGTALTINNEISATDTDPGDILVFALTGKLTSDLTNCAVSSTAAVCSTLCCPLLT